MLRKTLVLFFARDTVNIKVHSILNSFFLLKSEVDLGVEGQGSTQLLLYASLTTNNLYICFWRGRDIGYWHPNCSPNSNSGAWDVSPVFSSKHLCPIGLGCLSLRNPSQINFLPSRVTVLFFMFFLLVWMDFSIFRKGYNFSQQVPSLMQNLLQMLAV